MKHSLILKQHIPFAEMILKALDFSEVILTRSASLYPFAVLSIDNDVQCIFSQENKQLADTGMIEDLQNRINERKLFAESAISLLVYSATITEPNHLQTDALVLTMTDSSGKNNVTIYPYTLKQCNILFAKPYTCDFSD